MVAWCLFHGLLSLVQFVTENATRSTGASCGLHGRGEGTSWSSSPEDRRSCGRGQESGVLAAKGKAIFTTTHGTGVGGAGGAGTASHEALEKAKSELQKAANDIEEAEAATTTKSMMPLGLLAAFGLGPKEDAAVAALRRARVKGEHGDERRVRLSTVPERCTDYGDFL